MGEIEIRRSITERLRQIELLYHAALEHDESAWATFLDRACAGDEGLRREVDSLLSYSKCSEDFIETPALAIMAKELAARIDDRTDSRPRKREARGSAPPAESRQHKSIPNLNRGSR
jgi:hypothetical protein